MDVFLTIAGLVIGVSAFIYFVNAIDAGKRAVSAKASAGSVQTRSAVPAGLAQTVPLNANTALGGTQDSARVLTEEVKDSMPVRRCPLCSSVLKRDEPLYASNIEVAGERKILIYGCPYCHKWDKKGKS
jgi:hypothetical protein